MKKLSSAEIGKWGESTSRSFLELKGLRILHENYRVGRLELDMVALDEKELVFVEVKLRRRSDRGEPSEAVGYKKRRDLSKAAACYLSRNRVEARSFRFDVISIVIENDYDGMRLKHLRGAFQSDEDLGLFV